MKNHLKIVFLATLACLASSFRGKAFQRVFGRERVALSQPSSATHHDTSSILTLARGGDEIAPEGVTLQGTVHAEDLYLPGLLDTLIIRSKVVSNIVSL